ncbi:hypothetical protein U1Q18_025500, partial [Sarracenia purpurea var. burkii]
KCQEKKSARQVWMPWLVKTEAMISTRLAMLVEEAGKTAGVGKDVWQGFQRSLMQDKDSSHLVVGRRYTQGGCPWLVLQRMA